MFIFKKFQKQNSEQSFVNNNGVHGNALSRGVQPMDQHLQKKFARGIQYNMKIIIRGDRNVGKTCLFYRLQGDKFHEQYIASEEIKVASIQWNYNATDDIVKVEIWDVVDKGKKRENLANTITSTKDVLKMHNTIPQQSTNNQNNQESTNTLSSPALDAEFVDVYKGTNGVIFLFDMTKAWTFDYIVREINRCPLNIPILILANHRDMGHHRVVTADQVEGFIDQLLKEDIECNRKRTGQIRYAESSMRNGFGLRYLYKFFNLPYLHLQRETMLRQLERNLNEIDATCQELDAMADSDEYNYDNFLEMITNKRRQIADQLSAASIKNNQIDHNNIPVPPRSISVPANMTNISSDGNLNQNPQNDIPQINKPMPSIIIGANNPLPPKFQQQFQKKSPNKTTNNSTASSNDTQQRNNNLVKNIEDFVPDDGEQNMFRKFLDEPSLPQPNLPQSIDEEDSEDEDSTNNHLVIAKYQEELDPEDMIMEVPTSKSSEQPNLTINEVTNHSSEVNKELNEINSEPEDNQDRLTNITENSNVESAELTNQQPVLNCEDIEALENLYISKYSSDQVNGHDNLDNDPNVGEEQEPTKKIKKSKKSTVDKNGVSNNPKKKKKSSALKTTENETNDSEYTTNVTKKKKKIKSKNDLPKAKNLQNVNDDDNDDDDRKKLEEFLGADLDDDGRSRDHTSYQMF